MNHPIANRLRDLLHAQPFHPFVTKMIDGSSYRVPHEDFVTVSKSGHVLYDDGKSRFRSLNVTLISEIHDRRAATA